MSKVEKSRETPPWAMFFEGPLYRKYDDFMRHHDFSKILANKRRQLSNDSDNKEKVKNPDKHIDPWENPEYDNVPVVSPFKAPSMNSYEYEEDRKRRRRRTCFFVCSAMFIILLLSVAAALVIHYVFIVPKDGEYKAQVNVSVEETGAKPNLSLIDPGTRASTTSTRTPTVLATTSKDLNTEDIQNILDSISKKKSSNVFDDLLLSISGRLKQAGKRKLPTTTHTMPATLSTSTEILKTTTPPIASTVPAAPTTLKTHETTETTTDTTESVPESPATLVVSRTFSNLQTSEEQSSFATSTVEVEPTVLPVHSSTVLSTLPTTSEKDTPVVLPTTAVTSTVPSHSTTTLSPTSPTSIEEYINVSEASTTVALPTTDAAIFSTSITEGVTTTLPTTPDEVSTSLPPTSSSLYVSSSDSEITTSILKFTSGPVDSELTTSSFESTTQEQATTQERATIQERTTEMTAEIDSSTAERDSTTTQTTSELRSSSATKILVTDEQVFNTLSTQRTTPMESTMTSEALTSSDFETTTVAGTYSQSSTTNQSMSPRATLLQEYLTTEALSQTTSAASTSSASDSELDNRDIVTDTSSQATTNEISTLPSTSKELVYLTTETSSPSSTSKSTTTENVSVTWSEFDYLYIDDFDTSTISQTPGTTRDSTSTDATSATPGSSSITTTVTTTEETTPITTTTTTATTATTTTTTTTATTNLTTRTTTPGTTTTTTTTEPPTTLPPIYNVVSMKDVTAYTFEPAKVHCDVKVALKWSSLAITGKKGWRPLELKLFPDGHVAWKSKRTRHRAEYVIDAGYEGVGNNITLDLIIDNVQCRDGDVYSCILLSEVVDKEAKSKVTTVGKPGKKIGLSLGPSIIEDRAIRLTVTWDGGFPIPWTNVTWTAIDRNNNSYDLSKYGEYREFVLHVDDHFCKTRMQQDFVIFPKMHLNGTKIIVKPDMTRLKPFVNQEMSVELMNVEPGEQSILVIPLDYCKSGKQEAIPHPYEDCTKFVWCLPGDLVVQQCPFGTCFYEKHGECLRS